MHVTTFLTALQVAVFYFKSACEDITDDDLVLALDEGRHTQLDQRKRTNTLLLLLEFGFVILTKYEFSMFLPLLSWKHTVLEESRVLLFSLHHLVSCFGRFFTETWKLPV